jgi:hypothetical protein|nr:MAG TPA: Minor capsid protein [Caudoviricetes sp.]
MKCKVSVKLNRDALNVLDKAKKMALVKTAEAVKNDIAARNVVPKDSSELENSGDVDDSMIDNLVASIVYDTPYARRWYFNVEGAKFQKTQNVNARDHWMDYYLDGEGKQWVIDKYCEFFRQESRGLVK